MTPQSINLMLILALAGCNGSTGPNYDPKIPTSWASAVTNPYFPLVPGTTYEYRSQTTEGLETDTVRVLAAPRVVNGVTATVVWDRVSLDGSLIEETYDWYAQDSAGNVWYLGEDSKEWDNGQVVSTEGSWEWAVNGALPGIIMWADPAAHVGESYRQEFLRGTAEDFGKVVATSQSVDVPYGSFAGCIQTEDWSALAASTRENKYYCSQIGVVLEVTPGAGGERVELITFTTP